jgi:hypothetical protein
MLIAVAHIAGAMVLLFLLYSIRDFLNSSLRTSRGNKAMSELAMSLGVKEMELINADLRPRVLQYLADKYSSDRFCNRFSDLLGVIVSLSFALSCLVQFGCFVGAIWNVVYYKSADYAPVAWMSGFVLILIAVWIGVLSFACRLLTGRYPGEARSYREQRSPKGVVGYLNWDPRIVTYQERWLDEPRRDGQPSPAPVESESKDDQAKSCGDEKGAETTSAKSALSVDGPSASITPLARDVRIIIIGLAVLGLCLAILVAIGG